MKADEDVATDLDNAQNSFSVAGGEGFQVDN